MNDSLEAADLWPFFLTLAGLAAEQTLPRFRTTMRVEDKATTGAFDPVTEADRAAERALRAAIIERYPHHGIIGEEEAPRPAQGPYSWILDPIDGTRSFMSGMPTWGTLVGLLYKGVPQFGMMSQPLVGDCFIGGAGRAELIRQEGVRPLSCRAGVAVSQATLFSTTPDMFAAGEETSRFETLCRAVRLVRFGADCYGYALLAAGFVDLVVEANLKFFDIAPLIPLIEAAGGVVTDWEGCAVRGGGRVVAASDAALHEAALRLLSGAT